MRRRSFTTLLGGAAAWPVAARAQQGERLRQIIIWMGGHINEAEGLRLATAFREGLTGLGWSNGRNARFDFHWETDEIGRSSLTKQFIEQKPDVIVAETTAAVTALAREGGAVPIVFINVGDPIGAGFVRSLEHPDGTITGFISNEPSVSGKWPGLLKEIAPAVIHMGFLFEPAAGSYIQLFLRETEAAAQARGVTFAPLPIGTTADIEPTIAKLGTVPGCGLIVAPGPLTNTHTALIIALAARHRIPAVYSGGRNVHGGGLISYGTDLADSFRSAASYVDRILRGEKPGDLPVQFPIKFYLAINLKTATSLGLEVPTTLLAIADDVIE